MSWAEFFALYPLDGGSLFSTTCVDGFAESKWKPTVEDGLAAGQLHIQLVSRIATQPLGYQVGTEQAALDSIYRLFEETRRITASYPGCRNFELLAWDILNERVRPFTSKWHRESQRGVLAALDSTDEFRADLAVLQPALRQFDRVLCHLRDQKPPMRGLSSASSEREKQVAIEMARPLAWKIPSSHGNLRQEEAAALNAAERTAVEDRRRHYALDPGKSSAAGLALSGGGIRSATFSLGVLVALARRGLLPQFDFLSTVSGGGYFGSFLSAYLQAPSPQAEPIGLRSSESPFDRHMGEAAPLRYIRHCCRYLAAGSRWSKLKMVAAQIHGMILNGLGILVVAAFLALLEWAMRHCPILVDISPALPWAGLIAAFSSILAVGILRFIPRIHQIADGLFLWPLLGCGALLLWQMLGVTHAAFHDGWSQFPGFTRKEIIWWLLILGGLPLLVSAILGQFGRVLGRRGLFLAGLATLMGLAFTAGLYLLAYEWISGGPISIPFLGLVGGWVRIPLILAGGLIYFFLFNVNMTSPHRHYRNKLTATFLIQPPTDATKDFASADTLLLSTLGTGIVRAPYHLINCALNVPSTENLRMQGRLTDFFLFSPRYCGSPLTGYQPTTDWEKADAHLNLGTAMAISGAAAAPQMGLGTTQSFSFWLALLNIRLGYWVRRPSSPRTGLGGSPGLGYLLREMLGRMDESLPWLNVTDGGHIENLGVYELLRRRCKYIVAIDGEQDGQMTFAALTTLQRLAAIDLGVRIDLDLDDLRLNASGLSRSHFRFARIHYPADTGETTEGLGYLVYVKLSLTGNEGEFIRRYRHDEPAFPHHPTANQFFTEAQFEAYRSLGEHIGDKLFLRAFVGDLATASTVSLEDWFGALGQSLLDPIRLD